LEVKKYHTPSENLFIVDCIVKAGTLDLFHCAPAKKLWLVGESSLNKQRMSKAFVLAINDFFPLVQISQAALERLVAEYSFLWKIGFLSTLPVSHKVS